MFFKENVESFEIVDFLHIQIGEETRTLNGRLKSI